MIRAVIDSRNLNLVFEEVRKHPVGKVQILAFGVIASRDTSLIGNDDKKVFQCLCGAAEIENSILESEGVTSVDVATLNIDNAISVQKKSLIARHRLAAGRVFSYYGLTVTPSPSWLTSRFISI